MDIERERKLFEAWYAPPGTVLERLYSGYKRLHTQNAWFVWKARAALDKN